MAIVLIFARLLIAPELISTGWALVLVSSHWRCLTEGMMVEGDPSASARLGEKLKARLSYHEVSSDDLDVRLAYAIPVTVNQFLAEGRTGEVADGLHLDRARPISRLDLDEDNVGSRDADDVKDA
jgi:hypothetical protein